MLFLSLLSVAAQLEVHGHRGARMVFPENTIPAYEYAIREGVDFIEIDTWVTSDDVVVVAHDPVMNEHHCKGPAGAEKIIRKMTLAEFRKWDCGVGNPAWPRQKAVPGTPPPTLDEVLALTKKYKKVRVNLEIKSDPRKPDLQPPPDVYARMVWDAIRRNKAEKRVLVQSFDFAPLREMKKIVPASLPISALYPTGSADSKRDFVAVAKDAGDTGNVSIHMSLITPEKVKQAHDAKIRVLAWTANTPADWDKLIAAQVDGIITDDPAALIAYLKARKLR